MKEKQKNRLRSFWGFAIIVLFLVGSLRLPTALGQESTQSFSDVPEGHKYFDAVEFLKERGIIDGYEDGSFKPDGTINRAEAMKIVILGRYKWLNEEFEAEAFLESPADEVAATDNGEPSEGAETDEAGNGESTKPVFSDVSDEWFAPYVLRAREQEIINGYTDGTFKPGNNINKAESLKIILLAFTVDETFVDPGKNPFPDVPFSAWYAKYVKYAKDKMVIEPDAFGNFNAATDITRGEFADIIYRVMYIGEHNLNQYDPSVTWEIFDRSTQGFTVKVPPNWEVFEELNDHPAAGNRVRTIFWKKDEASKQRTYMRQYQNSASAEIFILNGEFEKDKFFGEIRNAFSGGALIIETETNGMPTLIVESENGTENILDSYIYMSGVKIAHILGTYGNGTLAYKNAFNLRKIRENFLSVEDSTIDDVNIDEVMTIARENIQVDGKGRAILDMFDDLTVIETDTIGVGTGPVDYHYSAKANVTLKFERSFDVILDIEEGKTSGF